MVKHSRSVTVLYSDVPRLEAKFLCEGANNTAGGHLASLNWNIQSFESTHTLGCKITLTIATLSTAILFCFVFVFKKKALYKLALPLHIIFPNTFYPFSS